MALSAALVVPVITLVRRRRTLGFPVDVWVATFGVIALALCVVSGLNGHARTFGHPLPEVLSVSAHLLAVGVWVGGLAALALLGGVAWRALPPADRPPLVGQLVPRFSRVAIGAVAVVVVSGTANAFGGLNAASDLWHLDYGRVILAKIVLLAVALAIAARHLRIVPRRLQNPATTATEVRTFGWSSVGELGILVGIVALAAGLVAAVPGRSLALAAKGPVNQDRRLGSYTVQLFVDPTTVGPNQVHVSFVNGQGLAATEVVTAQVSAGPAAAALQPVPMRILSPGHFVGDTTLPAAGPYRLTVGSTTASPTATANFTFVLRGPAVGR